MNKRWFSRQTIGFSLLCLLLLQHDVPYVAAQNEDHPTAEHVESAPRFTHLTSDDGLVENAVNAVVQDTTGFMWIGTQAGLSRYDGYDFTTYLSDSRNLNSLSDNQIHDLYLDRDGMLWIGMENGGADVLDTHTETFTHYGAGAGLPDSVSLRHVFSIYEDSKDNFWFGGGTGSPLSQLNHSTQSIRHFEKLPNDADSFPGGGVWGMAEDNSGQIWMSSETKIIRYDLGTGRFAVYQPPIRGETRILSLYKDSAGTVWAGGSQALYKIDTLHGTMTPYPDIRPVTAMLEDESGVMWVGTRTGLYIFDPQTGSVVKHFQHNPNDSDSLGSDQVMTLYQDRSGLIWIGTGDNGVDIYDPRQSRFAYFHYEQDDPASLSSGTVHSLQVGSDQSLWIAIASTIDNLNLNTGRVTHYDLPPGRNGIVAPIHAVYQDHMGMVWVGTTGLGLQRLDPAAGTFSQLDLLPPEGSSSQPGGAPGSSPPGNLSGQRPPGGGSSPLSAIVSIAEDGQGNLWAAADRSGLYRIDATRQKVDFFKSPLFGAAGRDPNSPAPDPVARPPITYVQPDRDGTIWVGSWSGINHLDPRTGKFDNVRLNPAEGSDSSTDAIYADTNGLIWVASHDGLIRYDPASAEVRYYTTADGLPSNYLVGILGDGLGNLWISGKKGISRFTPSTETFRNYDVSDGLQGNEFSPYAFAQAADGRMFFGGNHGISAFFPQDITDNPYLPPVVITDFELFNQPVIPGQGDVLSHPMWATDNLTLDHDQNILSFGFAALSYAAPNKNRYRYRLDGFEDHWNETGSARRFATYTNLPAGSYIFRVQGSNNDGLWSDQEATLTLTILPPWWETTWFRLLVALGLVGLVAVGYQWRVYAIARRNRELEVEVSRQTSKLQEQTRELQTSAMNLRRAKDAAESANRAKSAFLANMSHELRSPLNVILGFAQVTSHNAELPNDAHENLSIILRSGEHLLALINQVLDLSKIEAGQMALNEVDFDCYRLLDDLEEMFILKADDQHLQLTFQRAADVPRYLNADVVKLRQVLINLIGNALKFTTKGAVSVRIHVEEGSSLAAPLKVCFEVEDTGVGIAPGEIAGLFTAFAQTASGKQAQEGTGLGLAISQKFVRLMGGDITVKSSLGLGSTFTFSIQCREGLAVETAFGRGAQQVVALAPGQPVFRILVADDTWANRHLLLKLLKPLGFEVREAENGQQVIEIAQDFQPHLVWMDIRMPIMDGLEATRRLKQLPGGQEMVIIALTASAYEEERAEVLAAGCDDFIRKPFRAGEIFDILSKRLGVRYIYSEAKNSSAAQERDSTLQLDQLKAALTSVPADWLTHLSEAVELGDVERIDAVIGEIEGRDAVLAAGLSRLAHRFEYDELLELLKEGIA